jgi:hypothetical protein
MPPKKQDFGGVLAQFVDSEGVHCSVGAWCRTQQTRSPMPSRTCRVPAYPIPRLIGHGCGSSKNINSAPTSAIFFVKLIMSICFICASSTFQ